MWHSDAAASWWQRSAVMAGNLLLDSLMGVSGEKVHCALSAAKHLAVQERCIAWLMAAAHLEKMLHHSWISHWFCGFRCVSSRCCCAFGNHQVVRIIVPLGHNWSPFNKLSWARYSTDDRVCNSDCCCSPSHVASQGCCCSGCSKQGLVFISLLCKALTHVYDRCRTCGAY
jgi:hypothetical protein